MTIFDQARTLANRTGRTLSEALAELGRRGARKRHSKINIARERAKAPVQYWWNDTP